MRTLSNSGVTFRTGRSSARHCVLYWTLPVAFMVFLCSINTPSQSCPFKLGDYELQFSIPDSNKFRCRNDINTDGYTKCTLSCTYRRPAAREINNFSVYFEYIAPNAMSANFAGSQFMCKSGSTDGRNRQDIQVLALPDGVSGPNEQAAVDQAIAQVFRDVESLAAKCPNARPPSTVAVEPFLCPSGSGRFELAELLSDTGNRAVCKLDGFGNTLCRVNCGYWNKADRGQTYRIRGLWTQGQPGRNTPLYGCPASDDVRETLRHSQRNILVEGIPFYESVPNQVDTILGRQTSAQQPPERDPILSIARELSKRLENSANFCPVIDRETCGVKLFEFQKTKALLDEIRWEEDGLSNSDERLLEARSELSRWNEVVSGLTDPNYDGAQAGLVRRLLALDPAARNSLRLAYGIPRDADAPRIARTVRDIAAERVDYYAGVETRKRELKLEESKANKALNETRDWLRNNSCAGNLEPDSCDLTGDWWLNLENKPLGQLRFTPQDNKNYSVEIIGLPFRGSAKIEARSVMLRIKEPDVELRFDLILSSGCKSGSGDYRRVGSFRNFPAALDRIDQGKRTFLQGSTYQILFEGKTYIATYERDIEAWRPIDVFYFKILDRDGFQVSQTDEAGRSTPLFGRFVRSPSFDSVDRANVSWHFFTWVPGVNSWVVQSRRIDGFEVR